MKELDNLIEKYKGIQLSFSIGSEEYNKLGHVWMDLESLKRSINEQHKKDIVKAHNVAMFTYSILSFMPSEEQKQDYAEQYYKDNFNSEQIKIDPEIGDALNKFAKVSGTKKPKKNRF